MQKIVDIARSKIGYKESPAGSNKTEFGEWFGYDGHAWCGMFVSWCYATAGYPLGTIDFKKGFAGVPFALKHFMDRGEVITQDKAQAGDIVIYDWNGDGLPDHTAIFEKDLGGNHFQAIEGNTGIANNSNGGEVMVRVREYSGVHWPKDKPHQKVYFIHPKVLDAEPHIV